MIVLYKTVNMRLYLQKLLLFFLLALIPGFRGAPGDLVNEELGGSDRNKTVDGNEMKKNEDSANELTNEDNCSSQINRIRDENMCVSKPQRAWDPSSYNNYLPWQLRCVVVKEIEENIKSNNNCDSALKSFQSIQSNKLDGNKLCDEFQSRTNYSNNPPESVKFLTNKLKTKTDCIFACFKTVKPDVFSYCQFILDFYTVKNDVRPPVGHNSSPGDTSNSDSPEKRPEPKKSSVKEEDQPSNNGNDETPPRASVSQTQTSKKNAQDGKAAQDEVTKINGVNTDGQKLKKKPGSFNDVADQNESTTVYAHEPGNEQSESVRYSPQNIDGTESEESHFFFYFIMMSGLVILFYVMMYNKKKLLALVIEGRKRNSKRRPNSSLYRKLDCNLEEAMASGPSTSTSNALLY